MSLWDLVKVCVRIFWRAVFGKDKYFYVKLRDGSRVVCVLRGDKYLDAVSGVLVAYDKGDEYFFPDEVDKL